MAVMRISLLLCFPLLIAAAPPSEIQQHPGGKELPADKYIHVVSEADSPVREVYIKTKDGLYVAAAMRKPKGDGPFPVLIHFHGAPGGRGMEKLVSWSRGDTGGPMWERFLQEGFVVVVADYRGGQNFSRLGEPVPKDQVTYADDAVAVIDYVKALPYVNKDRVTLYGVSLGGDVTMNAIARTQVHRAILGAGAPFGFLGARREKVDGKDTWAINADIATANVQAVTCPVLIMVGTADSLIGISRELYGVMTKVGKPVRMDIFENGYHDFVMGPQGHPGRKEPLMDITLDSLELAVQWAKQ
jgi:dipeptidyl aminopeptidase/acylaminoacyl peptidase